MDRSAGSRGPQPLAKAISEVIVLRGLAQSNGLIQLASSWKSIVRSIAGEPAASGSRATGISRGVLQVLVSNSALRSELVSFHKPALIAAFQDQQAHWKVRDIKFKLTADSPSAGDR